MTLTLPRCFHGRALGVGACVAALTLTLTARTTHGASGPNNANDACIETFKSARQVEQTAHLLEAQKLLVKCAQKTCGSFLQHACGAHYAQIESDIPTVAPMVVDDHGEPMTQAWVTMDGEPLSSRIDGRAIRIDPGLHTFVFATNKGVFASQSMIILQGQRNRPISATLATPSIDARASASPSDRRRPRQQSAAPEARKAIPETTPLAAREEAPAGERRSILVESTPLPAKSVSRGVGPYALGVLGVAGLGGFALLTYWGRKDNELLAQCSPYCPPASAEHIRRLYLGANVSLGLGVAALVASTTWMAIQNRSAKKEAASHRSSLALDVWPTSAGAVATVGRIF